MIDAESFGGCQTGKEILFVLVGKYAVAVLLIDGKRKFITAMKWFIENPAQQVQWQNGEQSSCCGLSFCCADLVNSVCALLSFAVLPVSAQGIALSAKTRKAIMRATIFIGCKGRVVWLKRQHGIL